MKAAEQTPSAGPAAVRPRVVVAVDVRSVPDPDGAAERIRVGLGSFPGRGDFVVRLAGWTAGGAGILEQGSAEPAPLPAAPAISLVRGGIGGRESALGPLLREGERSGAAALALLAGEPRGDEHSWLHQLLAPVLEEEFDYVCPAYARHALDGAMNSGIVYPLTRALYGRRLRQPLGGEAVISRAFMQRLLAEPDWSRDPDAAGGDAWLVARALAGRERTCQAWLGTAPEPGVDHEDASQAVERVLGLVFREMERHAERWQRVAGSEDVPSRGDAAAPSTPSPRPSVERLHAAFQLGERELGGLWSLVLPPTTLMPFRRLASVSPGDFRIDDRTWARIVFDFAVAWFNRVMERRQLLRSMTPLYLGWVASFANETRDLAPAATEGRIERLCRVFEAEKRYLMARWRWPDAFIP